MSKSPKYYLCENSQMIYHVEDYLDLMQGKMQFVEPREKLNTYLKSKFDEKIMCDICMFWLRLLNLESKISL